MAEFKPAFERTSAHEGYYVNDPADPGGETYRGIARKVNPSWSGWSVIDRLKKTRGFRTNERIPEADPYVESFFKAKYWDARNLSQVGSQSLAELLYDMGVHHGKATMLVQQTASSLGRPIAIDNKWGPDTLAAVNALGDTMIDPLVMRRIDYMRSLVAGNPALAKFENGWIARAESFKIGGGVGLAGIVLAGVAAYHFINKEKKA